MSLLTYTPRLGIPEAWPRNAGPLGCPVARTSVKRDGRKSKSSLRYVKDLRFSNIWIFESSCKGKGLGRIVSSRITSYLTFTVPVDNQVCVSCYLRCYFRHIAPVEGGLPFAGLHDPGWVAVVRESVADSSKALFFHAGNRSVSSEDILESRVHRLLVSIPLLRRRGRSRRHPRVCCRRKRVLP